MPRLAAKNTHQDLRFRHSVSRAPQSNQKALAAGCHECILIIRDRCIRCDETLCRFNFVSREEAHREIRFVALIVLLLVFSACSANSEIANRSPSADAANGSVSPTS